MVFFNFKNFSQKSIENSTDHLKNILFTKFSFDKWQILFWWAPFWGSLSYFWSIFSYFWGEFLFFEPEFPFENFTLLKLSLESFLFWTFD